MTAPVAGLSDRDLQILLRERAEILRQSAVEGEKGETVSFLWFSLGQERYALELSYLIETGRLAEIRYVPGAPDHAPGVLNLRGELVPALNLRPLLGLEAKPLPKELPVFLVLIFQGQKFAVAVDGTGEVVHLPIKTLKALPLSLTPAQAQFAKGEALLENCPLTLLDAEKILTAVFPDSQRA